MRKFFVNLFLCLFKVHYSKKSTPRVFITGESRLPGVFTTRELRLAGIFITGESFWTPGSHFTVFKEHTTIFKGSIILKTSVGYFNSLRTCDLCLQKLLNLKDSNRLPGVFIAGESITNTKDSKYIFKKFKIGPGHASWYQEKVFDEKIGHEKSRDTVPLRILYYTHHVGERSNAENNVLKILQKTRHTYSRCEHFLTFVNNNEYH
jgi:hypothetical protein